MNRRDVMARALAGTATATAATLAPANAAKALSWSPTYYPRTTAEIAASVTPCNYGYPFGDVRRYGADPTGKTPSDSAFAQWAACLSGYEGVIEGTFLLNDGGIGIPSNSTVRFHGAASVIEFTGSGACFVVNSAQEISFYRPNISLAMAGPDAIGIQVNGAWFLDIHRPRISGGSTDGNQVGIQINTSQPGNLGFGAYSIRIVQPAICACSGAGNLAIGIQTLQTVGDTTQTTHLEIYDGWINGGSTAAISLSKTASFRIVGTTCEGCTDAVEIGGGCNSGFLSLGEIDASGYGINCLDGTSSYITVVAPSHAGKAAKGYINTSNMTPDLVDVDGELRMYPNGASASNYGVSYKSQYDYSAALVESVAVGGPFITIRNVNGGLAGTGIQQLQAVAGISATMTGSRNLRGIAAFGGGTSVAVTLPNAEPDADYYIFVSAEGDPGGYLWAAAESTTNFTIYCSAATSATVNWLLVR